MENIRSVRKRTQIFSSFHFRRSLSIIVHANAVVKAYFVPTVPEIIRWISFSSEVFFLFINISSFSRDMKNVNAIIFIKLQKFR